MEDQISAVWSGGGFGKSREGDRDAVRFWTYWCTDASTLGSVMWSEEWWAARKNLTMLSA